MFLAWAEGFRAPQGCVPWDELFLGLTQAAALSCWGLQEGNAASCLRHWGQGEPVGAEGGNPVGTQPLWCGTPLFPLSITHRPPRSHGYHKVSASAGTFCKACERENYEAGEISVPPALGTLALSVAKPLSRFLTQNLEC